MYKKTLCAKVSETTYDRLLAAANHLGFPMENVLARLVNQAVKDHEDDLELILCDNVQHKWTGGDGSTVVS